MDNIKSLINKHNHRILKQKTNQTPKENDCSCNCRKKNECPIPGECMTNNVIYKTEVTTTDKLTIKQYIGMTSNAFKNRFRNHQKSFRDKKHQNETELSKFIWSLKEKKKDFEVKWSILKRAVVYHNGPRRCNLCLEDKLQILKADKRTLLNKRSELFSKCRHQTQCCIKYINRKKTLAGRTKPATHKFSSR